MTEGFFSAIGPQISSFDLNFVWGLKFNQLAGSLSQLAGVN